MSDLYDEQLEEDVAILESENEILSLELERLQDKFDEFEVTCKASAKRDSESQIQRLCHELCDLLGVKHVSDPRGLTAVAKERIKLLQAEVTNAKAMMQRPHGADMGGYVKVMLPATREDPFPGDYMYDPSGRVQPWERDNEPRDLTYQYYQIRVNDLVSEHLRALEALEMFIKLEARNHKTLSYTDPRADAEAQLREHIEGTYDLKIFAANKPIKRRR